MRAGGTFIGHASITLTGSALGGVLVLIDEVVAARFLGVETYGLYALAFMLAKIGEIIAVFGLPISVLHFLPVHLSRSEKGLALGTIVGGALLPLVAGSLFASGVWLLAPFLASVVFAEPRAVDYIQNLALAIPLLALSDFFGQVARGFGRALPYIVIRNLTPPLCYLPVLLYLWHIGGPQIAVTYGVVGAYLVGTLVGLAFVARLVSTRIGPVKPIFELRRLYTYAVPIVLNAIVSLAIVWTDLFLLGVFTKTETVGVYRGCMQIVIVFDLVMSACAASTAPIYPVLISEQRREELRDTFLAAVHLATLIATPLFLVILLNGRDILGLLGPQFRTGAAALSILAFGHLVKVSFGAATVLLILGGKQALEARNGALAAAINLVLNLLLIPQLELLGAALATATSLIVLSLLRIVQIRRSFEIETADKAILRVFFVTVPIAVSWYVLSRLIGIGQGTGDGNLILRLCVLGALIAAAIWWICLSKDDRTVLKAMLVRKKDLAIDVPPSIIG